MVFSSITFLCIFLPIVIFFYFIVPNKFKNFVLLIFSLIFYAWGEFKYILVMLFSIFISYLVGILINKYHKKYILIIGIILNLGLLFVFKYFDFLINNINNIFNSNFDLLNLTLPIGISFYTFQTISYMVDVYKNKVNINKNIINYATYVAMFPQLIAGPIVRYSDIEKELNNRKFNIDDFIDGLFRFCIGLFKKVLIANQIGLLYEEILGNISNLSFLTGMLGILFYSLQIYFDFSGYSDMAIGLGRMFGFKYNENFNYPYESKSITEFWQRWHISLSSWFKEYVYIPLGGNKFGIKRQILNILIVWLLTGVWHGAAWNFVIWGLYYFILLIIEKIFLLKFLNKIPSIFSHIYTLIFIGLGWLIFSTSNISNLIVYLKTLTFKNGFIDNFFIYYISSNFILILASIILSTSLIKNLFLKIKNKNVLTIIKMFLILILIFVSIMFIISESYNPFLYFRF